MLPVTLESVRLSLHILAAGIWVGGQLVLGGLIPAVRPAGPERTRAVAHAFQRIAWPAFAVAVITGVWNISAIRASDRSIEMWTTLLVKLALVAGMLAIAAVNRSVITPRLARSARARAALAGLLSVAYLLWVGAAVPARRHWGALALSAAGTVVGFPLCIALALRDIELGFLLGRRRRCAVREH